MKNVLLILRLTKKQLDNDIKYNGIINAFNRKGYDVWATYNEDGYVFLSNGKTVHKLSKMNERLALISKSTALYRGVIKFIKKNDLKFDYCYIRGIPPLPGHVKMLKAIRKSGAKVAVEIPTYPMTSEEKTEKFVRGLLLKLSSFYGRKAAKQTDVYLPMGEETKKINNRPAVNIRNGIDVSLLSKRNYKPSEKNEIHMVAIARFARWHGYERVLEGMKNYYAKNPETKVYFHMVGPDGDGILSEYRKTIKAYNLSDYVILEGPKYGEESNAYFDMADVAISHIGVKNMKTVYPLKIVEYLARGIPFVYVDVNCQVQPDWDFCMSVPENYEPIDIDKVIEFARRVNAVENLPDKMRAVAVRDCSWDDEIQKMLDFFEKFDKRLGV